MTQKQLITANNAELEKHKQDILSLPMADDVKNGKYVWGKYKKGFEVSGAKTGGAIQNTQYTLTFAHTLAPNDLIGAKLFNPDGTMHCTFNEGGATSTGENWSLNNNILTISIPKSTSKDTITVKKDNTFLSYTVSDSETAYPDGGEKDGFWWERVKERDDIAFGTITLSTSLSTPLTIEHGLGVIPTNFGFVKKGLKPYGGTFVSDMSRCGYGYSGTMYGQEGRTGTVDERIMVFGYEGLSTYGFNKGTYMWFASEK